MRLNELNEQWGRRDIEVDGYTLTQEEELEEDNRKIFHFITPPNGKEVFVDHTPYEWLSRDMFQVYVDFHKQYGRFPSRKDINSNAPIHRGKELDSLRQKAKRSQQTSNQTYDSITGSEYYGGGADTEPDGSGIAYDPITGSDYQT